MIALLIMMFIVLVFIKLYLKFFRNKKPVFHKPLITHSHEYVISYEHQFKDKPKNFLELKLHEKNENNIINKINEKKQKNARIKGLSKGDDKYNSDSINTIHQKLSKKKFNLNAPEFSLDIHNKLTENEKKELDSLLINVLRKSKQMNRTLKTNTRRLRGHLIYLPQENDKLRKILLNVTTAELMVKSIRFFTKMRNNIHPDNLHCLTLLSIKYELLEWANFFLREMQRRKIQIDRSILDEFVTLNLIQKTMRKITRNNQFQYNNMIRRPIASQQLKYYFSRDGFRRIRQIFYELKKRKMNVEAECFYPGSFKKKNIIKNMNLSSEMFTPHQKNKEFNLC